jgi:hypothetical protein
MNRLALIGLAAVLALPAGPAAAQTTDTIARDLRLLEDDLINLDDSLSELESSHPREAELRGRADRIRERVDRLAEDVRGQSGGAVRTASREEIRSLRRDIATLQRDIDAATRRRLSGATSVLPEGTEIQVRLSDSLSSATARAEQRFEGTVALPVHDEQRRDVIPAGTRVRGIVIAAEDGERPARAGRLDLTFDTIYLDDRTATPLRSRVVSLHESLDKGDIATKRTGIGAIIGGVLGSILGGTKGAILGAVLGGAGAVVAKEGEDVNLPAGTIVTLRLERPLEVRR